MSKKEYKFSVIAETLIQLYLDIYVFGKSAKNNFKAYRC